MKLMQRLLLLVLASALLSVPMSQASSIFGTRIGAPRVAGLQANATVLTTFAMATNGTGWDARFVADSTLDVLAVTVQWTAVTAAGTVDIRIETDDGTGKPSGTLYDAAAHLDSQTPVVTTPQVYTFAVAPTTGLTIGTLYHAVIIVTAGGTTQTLGSYIPETSPGGGSISVLTCAATCGTRTNFAVVSQSTPAITLTRTGGVIECLQLMFTCFRSATTTNHLVTTAGAGAKIVTQGTVNVVGYAIDSIGVAGTAAGDLRLRVFDASDAVVSGSTVTVSKSVIVNSQGFKIPIGTGFSLTAGTYRLMADCGSCANSSNDFSVRSTTAMNSSAIQNATLTTTTNITASPPTWVDTNGDVVPFALIIDTITAPAAAGGVIGG